MIHKLFHVMLEISYNHDTSSFSDFYKNLILVII